MLAGLLAIAAVVVLIILKPGSSSGSQQETDVQVPGDVAEQDAAAEGEEGDIPTCADGDLVVTPLADKSSYAEGEEPQLSLSVENTGDEECAADLGTAGMTFEVTSGDDEVWRSADCQEDAEHLNVTLEPGEPLETESIAWDRTRSSAETCDITRDPVPAEGSSYHLRVSAAGVDGDGTAQFLLY